MAGSLTKCSLIVLGDESVGKTALSTQFCLNHFIEDYEPTIEISYYKQVQISGIPYKIEILDTAGLEEYESQRDQWIRYGQAFILVYSISSRASFNHIKDFHRRIQDVMKSSQSSSNESPPVILVGNKCDRVTEREVSTKEGSELAKALDCNFVETSAKDGFNVGKAFCDVIQQLPCQEQQVYSSLVGRKGGITGLICTTSCGSTSCGSKWRYSPEGNRSKRMDCCCVIL